MPHRLSLRMLWRDFDLSAGIVLTALGLKVGAALVEGVGIAALAPMLELASRGGDAPGEEASAFTRAAEVVFSTLGVPLSLPVLGATFFVIVVARQALAYASRVYSVWAQQHLAARLRAKIMMAAIEADQETIDGMAAAPLLNGMVLETQSAIALVFAAISALGNLFLTGLYCSLLFVASGWIAPAVLLFAGLLGAALRSVMRRSQDASREMVRRNEAFNDFILHRLRGLRLIRLAGTQQAERTELDRVAGQVAETSVLIAKLQARIPLLAEPLGILFLLLFFSLAQGVGGLSFELSLLVMGMLARLIPVVQEMAKAIQLLLAGVGSLESVLGSLHRLQTAREAVGGERTAPNGLARGIALCDVVYRYPGSDGPPALRGVNALFPAGKVSVIMGPSGAGKSTLIDLLPGLRRPTAGVVLLDGEALCEFSNVSLRTQIAYVPQQPLILGRTVRQHLCYGLGEVTPAKLESALRRAGAADFVLDHAEGLDRDLGEAGGRLSGGERQRLDLARALLRHAAILILDEPSSALDAISAAKLREAVRQIADEGRTTVVIIAHGFTFTAIAHKIIVLRDGVTDGEGDHEAVMRASAWYRDAWAESAHSARDPQVSE